MDSLVISSLGKLKITLLWLFCMSFGTHVHAFQLYIYLGMELLAYKLCVLGKWQSIMYPKHPCMSFLSVPNFKPHPFLILSSSCSWSHRNKVGHSHHGVTAACSSGEAGGTGLFAVCYKRCWTLCPVLTTIHGVSGFRWGPSRCPGALGGRETSTPLWCSCHLLCCES